MKVAMKTLGVSIAAVSLIVWLHLAGASVGNGFVAIYRTPAAAVVAAASLLLPSCRKLATL